MPAHPPFDRPRWSEEDARAVHDALERSGKPVRAFAEEHGLDPQRLYLWRRRVTALLMQAGRDPGVTDLFAMLREEAK